MVYKLANKIQYCTNLTIKTLENSPSFLVPMASICNPESLFWITWRLEHFFEFMHTSTFGCFRKARLLNSWDNLMESLWHFSLLKFEKLVCWGHQDSYEVLGPSRKNIGIITLEISFKSTMHHLKQDCILCFKILVVIVVYTRCLFLHVGWLLKQRSSSTGFYSNIRMKGVHINFADILLSTTF